MPHIPHGSLIPPQRRGAHGVPQQPCTIRVLHFTHAHTRSACKRVSSLAIPGYGAVPMVSLRNPVSRTLRAPEKRKRSWLEIESGGALVQSRVNTYLILSYNDSIFRYLRFSSSHPTSFRGCPVFVLLTMVSFFPGMCYNCIGYRDLKYMLTYV